MNRRTEGTCVLEGLIEGPVRKETSAKALRQWEAELRRQGIPLEVSLERNSFSIMPLNGALPVPKGMAGIHDALSPAIEALVALLAPEERQASFSTLRSVEYKPGQEIQTIYAIGQDGRVQIQQRTVPAQTTPPPRSPTTRQKLLRLGLALLVAGALLAMLAPFVSYRALLRKALASMRLPAPAELRLETNAFAGILETGQVTVDARQETVVIRGQLATEFGQSGENLERSWAAEKSLLRKLALEAVARERIRCDCYDAQGHLLGSHELRLEWQPSQIEPGNSQTSAGRAFLLVVPASPQLRRVALRL